jgi:hypothetical protein
MTATELINTKEILTDQEREIVVAFDKELEKKFLFNLGGGRWLNNNVYSEAEHQEFVHRMEMGF